METTLSREEIIDRISAARQKLGKDLVILAHFYQNMDIVRQADFVGDSLQLAQSASQQHEAKYIVFCAVSFMAQMARIQEFDRAGELGEIGEEGEHDDVVTIVASAREFLASAIENAEDWEVSRGNGRAFGPVNHLITLDRA